MEKNFPRYVAIFPISVVKEMTKLTARQIRYYEEHGLCHPARNEGNQRIYSLNDIERLLEIKGLIDQGVNIAGIKAVLASQHEDKENVLPSSNDHLYLKYTEKDLQDWLLQYINKSL